MFMEGRQIMDVVMVTNEGVDKLMSSKREGILCKPDMKKAYDHVNWAFVDYMLERLGFGQKWKKWMYARSFNSYFAVSINLHFLRHQED